MPIFACRAGRLQGWTPRMRSRSRLLGVFLLPPVHLQLELPVGDVGLACLRTLQAPFFCTVEEDQDVGRQGGPRHLLHLRRRICGALAPRLGLGRRRRRRGLGPRCVGARLLALLRVLRRRVLQERQRALLRRLRVVGQHPAVVVRQLDVQGSLCQLRGQRRRQQEGALGLRVGEGCGHLLEPLTQLLPQGRVLVLDILDDAVKDK
mmetsp:Transcript_116603/g.341293  ORF Transcript_116603/g.341293 Transcript_116603/m.341293 type:complete len:206 (+) Transcript_116603:573-1190(+)